MLRTRLTLWCSALTAAISLLALLALASSDRAGENSNQRPKPTAAAITRDQASAFAKLALKGLTKEYPNKPEHVLGRPGDLKSPRALHPAFYGCYDWHSSVHGHWMLVRLLPLFPDLAEAKQIRTALGAHLTADNLKAEADYFARPESKSFERPYGWAWLLKLAEELHGWDDPDAKTWSKNLKPLTDTLVTRYLDYFPKQTYPIRTGVHANTAFGLSFAHDYARAVGHKKLQQLVEERARTYFGKDSDVPAAWEPSGADFFSPSLMEADLMRRVLPAGEFRAWFAQFLPGAAKGAPKALFTPATVTDRSDPQLVHLDGLNLSRAWGMRSIATALPDGDPARKALIDSADRHAEAALKHVASGDYAGEHWLASFAVYLLSSPGMLVSLGSVPAIPAETAEQARLRHQRVAERRKGTDVICHRGASEHAHENTLEAFRATFELGGDGNEFDIRSTKDGVLVVFHDDMLDRLLEAHGDVSDYSWEQLQRFRFCNPGRFGEQCRIPTLVEVFELHRQHAGLMHLDIKRPGLDKAIAELLTRMDMWDHVGYCNSETGGVILRDARLELRRYKAGLYLDRGEVFPDAIAAAMKKPGDGVIVDDPRGVVVALARKPGKLSREAVSPNRAPRKPDTKPPTEATLIAILRKADDWDRVAETDADKSLSGQRIRARATAAEQLLAVKSPSKEAIAALEDRVRKRSLHKDWMYHGFDGAMALRTLILLRTPGAVESARFALWRDDPALEPVVDPRWKNPRAWTDFRVKMVIFPALEKCPGATTEKLCRDYLALSDEEVRKLGPPQFEEAARALLAVSPRTETALELLKHRLQVVRGRAILGCLAHAEQPWANAALEKGAPRARAYRTKE